MTTEDIKPVIDIIGRTAFGEFVRQGIAGDRGQLDRFISSYHPSDPFRQELRKAVRWVVENGMPE